MHLFWGIILATGVVEVALWGGALMLKRRQERLELVEIRRKAVRRHIASSLRLPDRYQMPYSEEP